MEVAAVDDEVLVLERAGLVRVESLHRRSRWRQHRVHVAAEARRLRLHDEIVVQHDFDLEPLHLLGAGGHVDGAVAWQGAAGAPVAIQSQSSNVLHLSPWRVDLAFGQAFDGTLTVQATALGRVVIDEPQNGGLVGELNAHVGSC